jgi:hypothetical protein
VRTCAIEHCRAGRVRQQRIDGISFNLVGGQIHIADLGVALMHLPIDAIVLCLDGLPLLGGRRSSAPAEVVVPHGGVVGAAVGGCCRRQSMWCKPLLTSIGRP